SRLKKPRRKIPDPATGHHLAPQRSSFPSTPLWAMSAPSRLLLCRRRWSPPVTIRRKDPRNTILHTSNCPPRSCPVHYSFLANSHPDGLRSSETGFPLCRPPPPDAASILADRAAPTLRPNRNLCPPDPKPPDCLG